jgi:hypothetical protein
MGRSADGDGSSVSFSDRSGHFTSAVFEDVREHPADASLIPRSDRIEQALVLGRILKRRHALGTNVQDHDGDVPDQRPPEIEQRLIPT